MSGFIFQLTDKCNQGCRFCYNNYGELESESEIDFKEYKTLLDFIKKDSKTRILLIGSGETLLYKDIESFLKYIKDYSNFKSLTTNGSLLLEYSDIIAQSIDQIRVSIHGLKETHNKITGENNFDKVIKGINKIRKINPNISLIINTVPCKENYEELVDLIKYFSKYKGVSHVFMHLQKTSSSHPADDFNSSEMVDELFEIISKCKKINPRVYHAPNISEKEFKKYYYCRN